MRVETVLAGIKVHQFFPNEKVFKLQVDSLSSDSRVQNSNGIFVAIDGLKFKGISFIEQAISNGAKVIICNEKPDKVYPNVGYIIIENTAHSIGFLSANFYKTPSKTLKVIGITGTNGKTTIAWLIFSTLQKLKKKIGIISTISIFDGKKEQTATMTTPNAPSLQKTLAKMVENGCEYCIMEVSSHALKQGRTNGLRFAGSVFTNITRDHLDYHQSFRDYIQSKKKLFDSLPSDSFALTNLDDKNGKIMLENCEAKKHGYSLTKTTDFRGKIIETSVEGMCLSFNKQDFWTSMLGNYNAYNLLATYGTLCNLGFYPEEILKTLSHVSAPRGRAEKIVSPQGIIGIVDYAHTPDALVNLLSNMRKIKDKNAQLFCIVGCGGNRDRGKRAEMANVSLKIADISIFTSDNPRDENPNDILDDMIHGILEQNKKKKYLKIEDRHEAIKTALILAKKGDWVIIAGKGHENYQEIMGIKYPLDDKKIFIQESKKL